MKSLFPLILTSVLTLTAGSVYAATNTATTQENAPFTIKHASGETQVGQNPQRVVLFDLGTFDTLDKLGVAERVIALPKGTAPDYLPKNDKLVLKDAGGMKEPNLDTLKALKPDLIIITGRQGKSYDSLTAIAPTLNLSIDAKDYLKSMRTNVRTLGTVFGQEYEADKQMALLDEKIVEAQAVAKASPLKALVITHNDGKIMPNKQSVIYDVIGVKQAALPPQPVPEKESKEPVRRLLTTEDIAAANPDIIFIIDRSNAIGATPMDMAKFEDSHLKATSAYKKGKIITLAPELWYLSGGGLQSLAQQVQDIENALK